MKATRFRGDLTFLTEKEEGRHVESNIFHSGTTQSAKTGEQAESVHKPLQKTCAASVTLTLTL